MPRLRHHPPPTEQAADALARVAPLASRWVERLLATHEPPLTPAQYVVLEAVAEGDVVGADLARRAAVTPAAVSQLLRGLEDAGLLARIRAHDDRRRRPLALTVEGGQVLRSARTLLRDRLAGLLGALPPPEAEALTRALDQVGAVLAGTTPPARPHRPPKPPPPPRPY